MPDIPLPGPKALPLLRVIVDEIQAGRIQAGQPHTFLSYANALDLMGVRWRGRAGQALQRFGLNELNEWTMANGELPKIAALIVNKRDYRPSSGFRKSLGHADSPNWEAWWLKEANRAIQFNWKPFLSPTHKSRSGPDEAVAKVQEDETNYHTRITLEPGKRGGRPCIRGLRITVGDILGWMAAGMSEGEILDDFPELELADIRAALAFSRDRDEHTVVLAPLAG